VATLITELPRKDSKLPSKRLSEVLGKPGGFVYFDLRTKKPAYNTSKWYKINYFLRVYKTVIKKYTPNS